MRRVKALLEVERCDERMLDEASDDIQILKTSKEVSAKDVATWARRLTELKKVLKKREGGGMRGMFARGGLERGSKADEPERSSKEAASKVSVRVHKVVGTACEDEGDIGPFIGDDLKPREPKRRMSDAGGDLTRGPYIFCGHGWEVTA